MVTIDRYEKLSLATITSFEANASGRRVRAKGTVTKEVVNSKKPRLEILEGMSSIKVRFNLDKFLWRELMKFEKGKEIIVQGTFGKDDEGTYINADVVSFTS